MDEFKTVVDGFVFADERVAQKACQEEDGIQYVKDRLDMRNPRMVLEMYHKLLEQRVFETPVGLLYLKELQNFLLAAPELEKESIEAIPVYEAQKPQVGGREKTVHTEGGRNNAQQAMTQPSSAKTGAAQAAAQQAPVQKGAAQAVGQQSAPAGMKPMTPQAAARQQETLEWYAEKLEESRQQGRLAEYRRRRAEERTIESKKRLRLSLLVSLFFILVAVGVGLVTLTDNHPNILNYENKLIEKYQDWENDLQNREEALKEKELANNP